MDFRYTYDALGNIQSMYNGASTTTYAYDALNQLVRVNDPVTQETHTYEYQNGNILFDHLYDYTEGELPITPLESEQYFYENSVWGDMLTGTATVYYSMYGRSASKVPAVITDENCALAQRLLGENFRAGQMPEGLLTQKSVNRMSAYSVDTPIIRDRMDIVSDEIGNPVNIGDAVLEWNGRQLQSINNGDYSVVYSYNTDEQRVKKVVSTSDNSMTYTYEYFYNGEILAGQKLTKVEDGVEKNYTLAFMYDKDGDAFGFICNGEPYYYVKNAQNDVILIMDADGVAVVLYQYDAWGKITQYFDGTEDEIGLINPLFYRSYYLDLEMEMYYLNSRYYLPLFHRFLNSDDVDVLEEDQDSMIEENLFAYCLNNPVNMADDDGTVAWWIAAAVAGAAWDAAFYCVEAAVTGNFSWKGLGKAALKGAVTGLAFGAVGKIAGKAVKAVKVAKSLKNSSKISKTAKVASKLKVVSRNSTKVKRLISSASKLKYSKTALKHINSRSYMNSTLTIQEIMRSVNPTVDKSLKNGLKWVVQGSYRGTPGTWELVVDCSKKTIVHFLFKT